MSLTRTLEKLERLGDSEADRALRPVVLDPADRPPGRPYGGDPAPHHGWRRRVLLAATVVAVVAVTVTWLVGWSPLLGASTVTVRGTATLTAAEVRTAADVPDGTPLVRLDTAAVARRVEAMPDVASARVAVVYPSTVTVTVVERVPVLYLQNPPRLVDATGLAYRTVATAPTGLPTTGAGERWSPRRPPWPVHSPPPPARSWPASTSTPRAWSP